MPRILLIMPDQWPRALLRAELIERGYDAVGAPSIEAALLYRSSDAERRPVRFILIDEEACSAEQMPLLKELLSKHGHAEVLLLASPSLVDPPGPWQEVIHRPVRLGEVASRIEDALH